MHAVVVTFEIKPAFREHFRQAVLANAAASLNGESACHRFDVCEAAGDSSFLLYELYENEAAFQAHLETAHFLEFDRMTADWIVHKRIDRFSKLFNPAAGQGD